MPSTNISVLISSFPGLTILVPYEENEPLHFVRDRVSNCLYDTTACVDPELACLYLDGAVISDYSKTMDHYKLFGDVITYKNVKVPSTTVLKRISSVKARLSPAITVHILTATGQNLGVRVSTQTRIKEFKQAISNAVAEKGSCRTLRLYFEGIELQDNKTLADFSVEANATTIYMLSQMQAYPTINVYIKTLTQNTCAFEVNLGQTVYQLKKSVADKMGIPVDEQRLTFGGEQLKDDRILGTYHIVDGSTGSISLRLAGGHDLIPTFADIPTARIWNVPLVDHAPRGREVTCGTNIEVKCQCTSYEVVSEQGFGLYELGDEIRCPNCHSTDVTPVTAGFVECVYRIHGVKANWKRYKSEWIEVTADDNYQYYDPFEQVGWRRLGIESKPLPRSKTPICSICLEDILRYGKTLPCGHQFHARCIRSWKLHCPNCRARTA